MPPWLQVEKHIQPGINVCSTLNKLKYSVKNWDVDAGVLGFVR